MDSQAMAHHCGFPRIFCMNCQRRRQLTGGFSLFRSLDASMYVWPLKPLHVLRQHPIVGPGVYPSLSHGWSSIDLDSRINGHVIDQCGRGSR